MPDLSQKNVLIILAYEDYQDLEFKPVKDYLSMFGAKISIASSSIGRAKGKLGGYAEVDFLLDDVYPEDFDAVIFIGGPGAVEFKESSVAHHIARQAADNCQVLAAICIAPIVLAKAGVLVGKKATIWASRPDDETIKELVASQAEYIDKDIVVDDNIITANGPQAAEEFARLIAETLAQK